jgi:hypothetical protein
MGTHETALIRPNRAQVLTTTWVASAQSYHRLKTSQVIPAQSSYTGHIVRKFLNIDTEHNTQQSQNAEARRR